MYLVIVATLECSWLQSLALYGKFDICTVRCKITGDSYLCRSSNNFRKKNLINIQIQLIYNNKNCLADRGVRYLNTFLKMYRVCGSIVCCLKSGLRSSGATDCTSSYLIKSRDIEEKYKTKDTHNWLRVRFALDLSLR